MMFSIKGYRFCLWERNTIYTLEDKKTKHLCCNFGLLVDQPKLTITLLSTLLLIDIVDIQ